MKIKISDIPIQGLDVDITEKAQYFDFNKEERSIFRFPIQLRGKVIKSGSDLYLKGTINTLLHLECSRCLLIFDLDLEETFDIMFIPKTSISNFGDDIELNQNELDTTYYEGDYLDMTEIIRQQLLLSKPMKPLCKEDCAGLCPKCGSNLNIKKCICDKEYIDPRWSTLKNLINNEGGRN